MLNNNKRTIVIQSFFLYVCMYLLIYVFFYFIFAIIIVNYLVSFLASFFAFFSAFSFFSGRIDFTINPNPVMQIMHPTIPFTYGICNSPQTTAEEATNIPALLLVVSSHMPSMGGIPVWGMGRYR